MTTRSGESSRSRISTCSSWISTSSSPRYAASVARPSGGNSEYLIGRQNGLFASVSAGRIILTFTSGSRGVLQIAHDDDRKAAIARAVELDEEDALPGAEPEAAVHDVQARGCREDKGPAVRVAVDALIQGQVDRAAGRVVAIAAAGRRHEVERRLEIGQQQRLVLVHDDGGGRVQRLDVDETGARTQPCGQRGQAKREVEEIGGAGGTGGQQP